MNLFDVFGAEILADELPPTEIIKNEMEEEYKRKQMKVVRSFHPVGQGAFYSERFYKGEKRELAYNVVYDCGTSWGTLWKAKKVIKQAFDKNDSIDYLFISHLDYDHVSLVETLIDSVKCVKNIVLPLVAKEEWTLATNLNRIGGHDDAVRFLERFYNPNASDDGSQNRSKNDFTTYIVRNDEENYVISGANIWNDGDAKTLDRDWDWVLIPRNMKVSERRRQLVKSLDKLFEKEHVLKEIQEAAQQQITTGRELLEKLEDRDFVGRVMRNAGLLKAIKGAYEKVAGGTNENSLLLYSGPKSTDTNYWMRVDSLPWVKRPFLRRYRAGCLYTGDSNCDINEWKGRLYPNVWGNIGTMQLPHHGSLGSFDMSKNDIDRFYFFPVSCGSTNPYGHPSGKVLAYLIANGCAPRIVTEMAGSVFMEVVED